MSGTTSQGLAYSPDSDVQGLTYSPSGATRQPNPSSLLALLWGAASGSGGGMSNLSGYSGNAPSILGGLSGGGAGYTPNAGSATSSAGTQDIGLLNTLAKNVGSAAQLYGIGNLGSKLTTGTGLGTGVGNLLAGYNWSGLATGSLLDSLSAQAASDVAGGLGSGGAIVGAAGAGTAGTLGALGGTGALAGLDAATLAAVSAASPALSGLGGLAAALAL